MVAVRRIGTTLLVGPVLVGLFPLLVAGVGPRVDRRLGLPGLGIGRANRAFGPMTLEAILAYKRETPFILPRRPRRW